MLLNQRASHPGISPAIPGAHLFRKSSVAGILTSVILAAFVIAALPCRAGASQAPKKPAAGSASKKALSPRGHLEALLKSMVNKIQHGKYREAVEDGKKAASVGKDKDLTPLILVNMAVAQLNLDDPDGANKTLSECEKEYGPNEYLLMNRGLVSLRLKEYDSAERSFLSYLERYGGERGDPWKMADAYYYLGEIYMVKGAPDAAYGFYFEATKQNPANTEAWLGLGDSAFQVRKWEVARNAFGQLQSVNGFSGLTPLSHFRYGTSLLRTGKLDDAEKHLAEYVKLEHLDPSGRYNLACVHALKRDTEKAMSELRMALELGFSDPVVKNDPDLQAIRGSGEFEDLLRRFRIN